MYQEISSMAQVAKRGSVSGLTTPKKWEQAFHSGDMTKDYLEGTLTELLEQYKQDVGFETGEPLDGDAVDDFSVIVTALINFGQGNM